jgi:hypothetical protein
VKRLKRVPVNETPWPKHWTVATMWDVPESIKLPRGNPRTLISREHEVACKGSPNSWILFDRHVTNKSATSEQTTWVDGFLPKPFGVFTSFRSDQIVKTRKRVLPRPKKEATK